MVLLRSGTQIETTDGHFGSLADVVVDPDEHRTVTHLVITPEGALRQTRVVPIWLTSETSDGIRVELDTPHTMQLQRGLPGDFRRVQAPAEIDDHELRFKSVLRRPFAIDSRFDPAGNPSATRVPADEVEIRCGSDVISTNDRDLGHVVGFLTSDDLVHAFVVRSGLPGFTHDVIVPLEMIGEVTADMILLDIDRHDFRNLAKTDAFDDHRSFDGMVDRTRHSAAKSWYSIRDRVYVGAAQWRS